MLTHLCIRNFTTVDQCELELSAGLSVITGETGAGKSVMLDALAMALGDRASHQVLRDESNNADISASFRLQEKTALLNWLHAHDLSNEDDPHEAILRRVITPSGRSRAYINGSPVNIADLKTVGEQLVDLHNQHEHQSLLDKHSHSELIDNFGGHQAQLAKVKDAAEQWQALERKIQQLTAKNDSKEARLQLLSYQVEELDKLALEANESETLASEQKKLANAEQLLLGINEAMQACNGDESLSALSLLQLSQQRLSQLTVDLPSLGPALELISSAAIQAEEAFNELSAEQSQLSINPERLQWVEQRLDTLYSIARKHQVPVEQLFDTHQQLAQELAELEGGDKKISALKEQQKALQKKFITAAKKLSKQRQSVANKLSKAVNAKLDELQMTHCQFAIAIDSLTSESPNTAGAESLEFLISTIPGKPPKALAQIASGGELSRISLAIAVVTAQTSNIPTVVFDEVDVGIGGGVAEVVGNLLRELGQRGQVFCVTHLAQVAAKGNSHLLAQKSVSKSGATTSITELNTDKRTAELARMMGGLDVTQSSIAHATEMLESA